MVQYCVKKYRTYKVWGTDGNISNLQIKKEGNKETNKQTDTRCFT